MDNQEFMERYNNLLKREKKAEKFLNDDTIDIAKREKWIPEYEKIVSELGQMIKEYRKMTGYDMPSKEMMDGF